MSARSRSVLKAVLGPTNTGKTHLAIERMLGHASGMIGLPLRLLAREVWGKITLAECIDSEVETCGLNPALSADLVSLALKRTNVDRRLNV